MGVTIMLCAQPDCGRMLNGELCAFIGNKPYCETHATAKKEAQRLKSRGKHMPQETCPECGQYCSHTSQCARYN